MRHFRMFAFGAIAALALAGCSTVESAIAELSPSSTQVDITAANFEQLYTAAADAEVAYAKTGVETPSQAQTIKALDAKVYGYVVAARNAVATGDNAGLAVAIKALNEFLPTLMAATETKGGGS